MTSTIQRCCWCSQDPIYMAYHDYEWGKPEHDENRLFEMLCLEGQQAGLSWITVLKKRDHYRQHFFNHSIAEIALFSDEALQEKLKDRGLIRHLGKLTAIRDNARAWQALKNQGVDVSKWLWESSNSHLNVNATVVNDYRELPTQTQASLELSKKLKKHGFKFVGATTCYAFMQAVGMVNDHERQCSFRYNF